MRILLCFSMLAFVNFQLLAQDNHSVMINYSYGKDTTSTFSIVKTQIDKAKTILINEFGNPTKNEVGQTQWTNISYPGLGDGYSLVLTDGIFFVNGDYDYTFRVFKDKTQKDSDLAALKEGQQRHAFIEIQDKHGVNVINSKEKIKIGQRTLDYLFKDLN